MKIQSVTYRIIVSFTIAYMAACVFFLILSAIIASIESLLPSGRMKAEPWFIVVMLLAGVGAASLGGAWSFLRLTPGDHGAQRRVVRRIWARRTGAAARAGTVIALLSFPLFLVTLPFLLEWISWKILGCGIQDPISYFVVGFGIAEDVTIAFLIAFIVILSYLASRLLYACMICRRVLDETPRCDCCGYNLTGNRSGRCPECGTPIDARLLTKDDQCSAAR